MNPQRRTHHDDPRSRRGYEDIPPGRYADRFGNGRADDREFERESAFGYDDEDADRMDPPGSPGRANRYAQADGWREPRPRVRSVWPDTWQDFSGRGPKGYRRSDDRIREDVSDRLTDDASIDASEIEIQVKDGVVSLSGSVSDRQQKRKAEDVAEATSGVADVANNIRVSRPSDGAAASLLKDRDRDMKRSGSAASE